jgi:hypothetical protein
VVFIEYPNNVILIILLAWVALHGTVRLGRCPAYLPPRVASADGVETVVALMLSDDRGKKPGLSSNTILIDDIWSLVITLVWALPAQTRSLSNWRLWNLRTE